MFIFILVDTVVDHARAWCPVTLQPIHTHSGPLSLKDPLRCYCLFSFTPYMKLGTTRLLEFLLPLTEHHLRVNKHPSLKLLNNALLKRTLLSTFPWWGKVRVGGVLWIALNSNEKSALNSQQRLEANSSFFNHPRYLFPSVHVSQVDMGITYTSTPSARNQHHSHLQGPKKTHAPLRSVDQSHRVTFGSFPIGRPFQDTHTHTHLPLSLSRYRLTDAAHSCFWETKWKEYQRP